LLTLLPAQAEAPQEVPARSRRHPPAPSQPFEQASSRQMPAGSAAPVGTFTQAPSCPGTAHDLQVPLQAPAQQRPWAHTLLTHSALPVQMAPFGFLPQLPALHTFPFEHWASLEQLPRQALPLQPRKGAQVRAAGSRQLPPMQTPAAVWVLAVPSHRG
jgi:hypothetical protein